MTKQGTAKDRARARARARSETIGFYFHFSPFFSPPPTEIDYIRTTRVGCEYIIAKIKRFSRRHAAVEKYKMSEKILKINIGANYF